MKPVTNMIANSRFFPSVVTALIIGAYGLSNAAHAGVATYADVFEYGSVVGNRDYGTLRGNTSTASVTGVTASSAAYAAHGALKARSSAMPLYGNVSAQAMASYDDYLTLKNARLTGQTGRVTFAYYLNYSGAVGANDGGFSNGSVSFAAYSGYDYTWFLDYARTDGDGGDTFIESVDPDHASNRVYGVGPQSFIYLTTSFVWGSAIYNRVDLSVDAAKAGLSSFDFDAGHSGYWAGITSITTGGVDIKDYTIESLSGTDYSTSFAPQAAIPEPATLATFVFGLALLGTRRRKNNPA